MRYVTRPRASGPRANYLAGMDDYSFVPHLTVDGPAEVDTGLIDPQGNPIYRLPPPIGFGRGDEW